MDSTSDSGRQDQAPVGWASFEQRVAESAEYLLILTFSVIFWMAGFVDLFTHASDSPDVLGLYSWPFALALLVYAAGFGLWGVLLFHRRGLDWFKQAIHYVQERAWLAVLVFIAFAILIASMYLFGERWIRFPLLEIAVLLLIVVYSAVLLLINPVENSNMQLWRKLIIVLLIVVAIVELLLQVAALLKISPVENLNGLFTPYGRVYSVGEGGQSGRTNANGWYYPDFRLDDHSERYVLVGGSYLLGLQVVPEDNMGVVLDGLMNADAEQAREVMSMAAPDYGMEVYLHERLYPVTAGIVEPDEVIVIFHTLNDFQAIEASNKLVPYAFINDEGVVDVPESDIGLRHDLWHIIIRGYDPPNPAQTLQSHLFVAALLGDSLSMSLGRLAYLPPGYSNTDQVSQSQPFGGLAYMYEAGELGARAQGTLDLAMAQLESWRQKAQAAGTAVRLVILPYFPAAFYETYAGDSETWRSDLGEYDLLGPERAVQGFANETELPVLPLGQYMQAIGLSADEIRALFLKDGTGHLTANGHQFVAEAIYACFYGQPPANDSAEAAVGCSG